MAGSDSARKSVSAIRDRASCDVLVIGGGINGISVFRDLAINGADVVLVERGDWAQGASASSSHMIHGGIRYLENGEFRLVRESVRERNALLRTAPHYVRPLPTTIPIFSTFSSILSAPLRFLGVKTRSKRERGALIIKVGLSIYDTFSRDGGRVPRHQFRGRRASRELLPQLREDVRWTATYYDASMHDPERLALDVLMDGLAAPASRASNYVAAVGAGADGTVTLRDEQTGEEFDVFARVVVNASGPWTDLTNASLGTRSRLMGGTKGSHIVLDHPELLAACHGREIFFEFTDGRIVLIYPLKGRVLVGTTDLVHDMTEPIYCTDDEVAYFLDLISYVFPTVSVERSHIVYRFAGVRPLPNQAASNTAHISRDYRVERSRVGASPVLSIVGGKWTTFRALGEQVADQVLSLLGRERTASTDGRLIGGAVGFPSKDADREIWVAERSKHVSAERVIQLLDRYGTTSDLMIDRISASDDAPLQHAPEYSRTEVQQLAETEQVVRLVDVVLRRTSLAFMGAVTVELLRELADIVGEVLDWDIERRTDEVESARLYLYEHHGIDLRQAVQHAEERRQS